MFLLALLFVVGKTIAVVQLCCVVFVPSTDNPFQPSIGRTLQLLTTIDCSAAAVGPQNTLWVSSVMRVSSNDRFIDGVLFQSHLLTLPKVD